MNILAYGLLVSLLLGANTCLAYPQGSMHWNHRSILFFAPEKDQHVQQFIKQVMMNECVLQERDIKTVIITHDGFHQPADVFSPETVALLQRKYNIKETSHTGVLVGKDGLEKHRWGKETNWILLTELIDHLPMRQVEMRTRPSRCSI
ncbi:DUF4174 domain-containing protein [Photobacterium sagamiensis]|uniref:DUF4174 domain-containing protein n=1 Tax=Photobacterium sagamiensis TaxID=2910241 RepID=UPI003D0C550C